MIIFTCCHQTEVGYVSGMAVMQVSVRYHVKSVIINLMSCVFKVVVIWQWITSYMTVARKKPSWSVGTFLLSLLAKKIQHSSLKKKVTQLPFVLVSTGVWTQKPCVLNGPVLLFGYWAGQCVSPPSSQPANRDPQVSPFISFFVPSGAHTSARAGRARRDPRTNGGVVPCRHSDLTRFTYGAAITVPVPTRISDENCRSCLHMFIRNNVRSMINSIFKG